MRQSTDAALKGQPIQPEQQRIFDKLSADMAQAMREEMRWDSLRPLYQQIYRESFTQEEIDGLVAFYRSPVGAAFVDKMPMVMQKSMALMQARMGPMMERLKPIMDRAMRDIRDSQKDASPASLGPLAPPAAPPVPSKEG